MSSPTIAASFERLDPVREYEKQMNPPLSVSAASSAAAEPISQKILTVASTSLQYGALLGIGASVLGLNASFPLLSHSVPHFFFDTVGLAIGTGYIVSKYVINKEKSTPLSTAMITFFFAASNFASVMSASFFAHSLANSQNSINTAKYAEETFGKALEARAKAFTLHSTQWAKTELEEAIKASALSKEALLLSKLSSADMLVSCFSLLSVPFTKLLKGPFPSWIIENSVKESAPLFFTTTISSGLLALGAYFASKSGAWNLLATAATYFLFPKKYRTTLVPLISTLGSSVEWSLSFGGPIALKALTATILGSALPAFYDKIQALFIHYSQKIQRKYIESSETPTEKKATAAFCKAIVSQLPKEVEKNAWQHREILFYQMIDELIKSPSELSEDNLPRALSFQGKGCNLLQEIDSLRKEFRSLKPEEQASFQVSKEENQLQKPFLMLWKKARNVAAFLYQQSEETVKGSDTLRENLSFAPPQYFARS